MITMKKMTTVKIECGTTKSGLTRRTWIKLTAGAGAAALTGPFFQVWGQTPQSDAESDTSKAVFQNPLFAGDYPDCSILRVGEDFYMTHTSYSYAPGLVVWHSRDLVNWTPISQVWKLIPGHLPKRIQGNFPSGGILRLCWGKQIKLSWIECLRNSNSCVLKIRCQLPLMALL